MKKNVFLKRLLLAAMMAAPFGLSAQVTIGSGDIPKTTLDIIGDTATVHGEAFRLIDGNQALGKVITSNESGIGTWKIPAISITESGWSPAVPQTFKMSNYYQIAAPFIDFDWHIDLEPGKYLMIFFIPFTLDFPVGANEAIYFATGLSKGVSADYGRSAQTWMGPIPANALLRRVEMTQIDLSAETSTTRFYFCYFLNRHLDANGAYMYGGAQNHPGTVTLAGNNIGGVLWFIPLSQ